MSPKVIAVLPGEAGRVKEALALCERDLDPQRGSVLVRHGKGGRRREVGMDAAGFSPNRGMRFCLGANGVVLAAIRRIENGKRRPCSDNGPPELKHLAADATIQVRTLGFESLPRGILYTRCRVIAPVQTWLSRWTSILPPPARLATTWPRSTLSHPTCGMP